MLQPMNKNNKNQHFTGHSRVYLWHRFEQVEADCYSDIGLSIEAKKTSYTLLGLLIDVGIKADTLSEKDVLDMEDILKEIRMNCPEIVEDILDKK